MQLSDEQIKSYIRIIDDQEGIINQQQIEIDALKSQLAAQRAAVLEEAAEFARSHWGDSDFLADSIRALGTQQYRDALEKIKQERDNLWIAAFGADDLEPRVTPESLADWVFRDVQQQLDGLKKERDAHALFEHTVAELRATVAARDKQIAELRALAVSNDYLGTSARAMRLKRKILAALAPKESA